MDATVKQTSMDLAEHEDAAVTCLGIEFPNDDARRAYFRDLLQERLNDPEFRQQDGFPDAKLEDILEMSDPPYYTACPNPFLKEFIELHGRPWMQEESYSRAPLAVDVSVGKTDALYKAHGYHTKVPHQAIVPSILHYTDPDDIILDGFGGSGMTGLAAAFCGKAPPAYRTEIERDWKASERGTPKWGSRRAIINDLSPAASFIAKNYTTPFDVEKFAEAGRKLLDDLQDEIGWMYQTTTDAGETTRVDFTVWSEVFSCPECAQEINFIAESLVKSTGQTLSEFPCPSCGVSLNKSNLERIFQTSADHGTGEIWRRVRMDPALVFYSAGGKRRHRKPTQADIALIARIAETPLPLEVPTARFPIETMAHGSRIAPKGFTHIHHFFTPRAARAMAALWKAASSHSDDRIKKMLLFFVEQAIWTLSILNRYRPTGFSQFGQYLSGVYYVPSQHAECSPWYILEGKLQRLVKAFRSFVPGPEYIFVSTGTASSMPIQSNSIDYVFTDPPFGENIYYADLNYLVEAWHGVTTKAADEAIVDSFKGKGLYEYQDLMHSCFAEYFRVLKPGRWMTVVFSNSRAAVWNSIQVALQQAGFVVAEVTALDKTQGSYRQVTSANAVKQDLVVSCYKPNGGLEERFERGVTDDTAWDFVRTHLKNLAVAKRSKDGALEIVAERDPRRIFDRMIAWFVRHNTPVPISSAEFQEGLLQRFPERDGMVFLPNQVDEYDRKRLAAGQAPERDLFVDDERSAIDWLTDFLKAAPSTYQEIHPDFTQKTGAAWRKHEERPELASLLDDNFLKYDGKGPVPNQIHSYLSSNWKDLRNLEKDHPALVGKAQDRWYVPDPNKQQDVEKRRDKALIKEFDRYRTHKGRKLKEVRLEAMRVGFKSAWAFKEYQTIIDVAAKVPEDAWQEDEKLLMYFDMATSRLQTSNE